MLIYLLPSGFGQQEIADVAQMVVRRIGNAEVTGPIPVISCLKSALQRSFLMP
jgi:hypothetical protein